jgi:hypothetical protein
MRRTGPRRSGAAVATAAIAIAVCPSPSPAGAATRPPSAGLPAAADAFVSARQPRRNFGGTVRLAIARRPARRAYLRFELPAPRAPRSRVTLYVRPLRSSRAGLRLRRTVASWDEATVASAGAPRTGRVAVRSGPLRARRWKKIDVTRLAGRGNVVSLALTTSGRKPIVLASREAGSDDAPRLAADMPGWDATAPVLEGQTIGAPLPPAAPAGPPLWRGDLETADFSQWDQLDGNVAAKDLYFGVVSSPFPVAQGRYAFRSTVDANATAANQAGQRSMLLRFPGRVATQNTTGAFEGGERWYRTRVRFPLDFRPSPNTTWNWVVQWHNWPDGPCCPNLTIGVDSRAGREALTLRVMGGGDSAYPVESHEVISGRNPRAHVDWFVGDGKLKRDHWYDSLTHVKWSVDGTKGLVEWWLDGRLVVSRTMSTLYWYRDNNSATAGATPGPGQAYYMEGYYRPDTLPNGARDTSRATVYFDGAQLGAAAGSVSGP